jgi:NAD(P)-dependent dehydrogenase (short-subunit alcohol dehydrogenase family)
MTQKQTWVVTGGNSGLGYQCARFLARDPDSLIVIACRDAKKGEQAAASLRQSGGALQVLPLDLTSLASVRAFVETLRAKNLPPLAGIVCNAGGQSVGAPTRTAEGHEATFGVNHLAHYLLARLLLPDLKAGAGIVFVSSGTHDPKEKTGLPEPRYQSARAVAADFEVGADAGRRRYTTSKLCNIYCAYEFARRLSLAADPRLRSIRVNAFDPGMMPGTGLARTYPAPLRFVWNYILPIATLFRRNVHRPSTSGERLAKLVAGAYGGATGTYYSDGREARSSDLSYLSANARELWTASAEMTGLSPDLEVREMAAPTPA